MIKINVSPEAQNDLQDIKDYITHELESPTAALNTISKITKAMRRLMDFPNSGILLSSVKYLESVLGYVRTLCLS